MQEGEAHGYHERELLAEERAAEREQHRRAHERLPRGQLAGLAPRREGPQADQREQQSETRTHHVGARVDVDGGAVVERRDKEEQRCEERLRRPTCAACRPGEAANGGSQRVGERGVDPMDEDVYEAVAVGPRAIPRIVELERERYQRSARVVICQLVACMLCTHTPLHQRLADLTDL